MLQAMERNNLYPVFLKLKVLRVLIVGGGNVALEKISLMLKSSPDATVTLVAPSIHSSILELAKQNGNLKLIQRKFNVFDLWSKDLVLLATDNYDTHVRIRRYAHWKGLLVNVADTPELCDFYLGAVITKGNLKVAISTNGKSPTMAKRMREYFEEVLPENVDELLTNMNTLRNQVKGDLQHKVEVLNDVTSSWLSEKQKSDKTEK
jgi:precorrin-2 dehydrogenase / sirohydrochlorin ferrochelatase